MTRRFCLRIAFIGMISLLAAALSGAGAARAGDLAFRQAVAEAAAPDAVLRAFYKARDYDTLWTGADDRARRTAFLDALDRAGDHGLPTGLYDPDALRAAFAGARTPRARGAAEVLASRMFLDYAEDIQSGILDPGRVESGLVLKLPRRDPLKQIEAFAQSTPAAFLRALPPQEADYTRLMKEKIRLERLLGEGGWGATVRAEKLELGDTGPAVVALRDRLVRMGYMRPSAVALYDGTLQKAVQQFQIDHGLTPDGVAGAGTLGELNRRVEDRLAQVVVALERRRWLNKPRGERHILVNQADFHAFVIDNGKVSFETRVVVGKSVSDQRTPEFSDEMTHMVVNPTWNVPRSIATKEYLPMLKRDPNAVSHINLIDASGRIVNREAVDFTQFTPQTFPFDMKEPPSRGNALGLVKFMFPNRYNIYLHDTPHKSLFSREVRAYSHGCVRLHRPFEFAYTLLERQTGDPEGLFKAKLDTGRETVIPLEQAVPVHLVYWTAWVDPKGRVNYRRDIYGRDGRVFDALRDAGVELRAIRG